jgi:hypothetical protein
MLDPFESVGESVRSTCVIPRLSDVSESLSKVMDEVGCSITPLDSLVGAIVSLYMAKELGYKDRTEAFDSNYRQNLFFRCEALVSGTLPTGGWWMAGYYFNSALLRIAASYHQCLKLITGEKRKLVAGLLELIPAFPHESLTKVHIEVNSIKHDRDGLDAGRTVMFDEAVAAIEELLALISTHKDRLRFPAQLQSEILDENI